MTAMPTLAPAHPDTGTHVPMRMGFDLVQISQVEEAIGEEDTKKLKKKGKKLLKNLFGD